LLPAETQRGGRVPAARALNHRDGRAKRPEPGDQRARDPAIGLAEVAGPAEVVRGGDDAVGQLALGAIVVDRAPPRRPPHEADAEPPARLDAHVAIEGLTVAGRP